jgi:radical SAM protein with 4Fe4S-binding SPASM domain
MTTFETHPTVMWELTRACDLHCCNCTIGATKVRGANELSTYEAYKTIDQIAGLGPREFIITGGDPLERDDVAQVVNYARRRGLDPAFMASPSSQLTGAAVERLVRNGLTRIIFSLDGSTAELHEGARGAAGTFARTVRAIRIAEVVGLKIEINTLITRRNVDDLTAIADLIRPMRIARWNLYFLVPMIASSRAEMLTADQAEKVFAAIDGIRGKEAFAVRVVEAPHYRRFRMQRDLDARLGNADAWADFAGYENRDGGDLMDSALDGARGFVFISHAGDVRASEFLPLSAGNLRYRSLEAIYRSSDLFVALRDPNNLRGKCGRCEFRHICGGSRARAWAVDGNVFGDDPLCAYEPGSAMPLPGRLGTAEA